MTKHRHVPAAPRDVAGPGGADTAAAESADRPAPLELPDGRRAGPHLTLRRGLVHTAERAAEIGATSLQVFIDNPTAWRRRSALPDDLPLFRRRLTELDVAPLSIHAAYLVNLAGPDDELFGRSIDVLRHDVEAAAAYGARFVNVHVGSHRGSGRDAGVSRLVEGLCRVLGEAPVAAAPLIVLENPSGGGYALGSTIDELAAILDAAARRRLDGAIGFCLDTAHLWGAGYDVAAPEAVDRIVAEFDAQIGLGRLVMVHFNDSHSARGSRHDRHAHLGTGLIGLAGMRRLLCHPALGHVAYIVEAPGTDDGLDALNLARLADIAGGRPLTPFPERAGGDGPTETAPVAGDEGTDNAPRAGRGSERDVSSRAVPVAAETDRGRRRRPRAAQPADEPAA